LPCVAMQEIATQRTVDRMLKPYCRAIAHQKGRKAERWSRRR
jgi:hypothetical protein